MINELLPTLTTKIAALRRDIHAHPELAFDEHRTAAKVADYLEGLKLEVHRGIARTGVVAKLSLGTSKRAIGLRADMDALPLAELNTFPHHSTHKGKMHACGHDGHTAMLLGAAEALSTLRNFDGTVYFIFQPAEEHEGGGRVMVEEGLFDRFPMGMVFGLHNWPGMPAGSFGVTEGPVMAGTDRFEIELTGRGGHAAMPHQAVDVVLAGSALVQALQSLVSRNTDPLAAAVVSVTRFHAGHADNVLPESAVLGGTVRTLNGELQDALELGLRRVCTGIEATYGVSIDLRYERGYPPTVNAPDPSFIAREAARQVVGDGQVLTHLAPSMGAEDFAYLARVVPACYVWLGNGPGEGGCMLHSPHYDFNDEIIATGIRYWVRLAERALA
ncbi:MAG: peptidase M20 [Rhodocyclales bacterium RIFCSPLOWO2_02_FULL_63_24]|nr:MAG: peptidase M20 [Rhodocyclales bacterium RIFCSPLOWO2_02_FULL_63_24]